MKIKINGMTKPVPGIRGGTAEARKVWTDPEGRYAVAEIFTDELYLALKIEETDGETLTGEYVDRYERANDVPMLMRFTVDWGCIRYGFCKLLLWAPELAEEAGGGFEKTVKRFYFDRELYEKSYEELNGVPYGKKGAPED